jgi:hypothetical protein
MSEPRDPVGFVEAYIKLCDEWGWHFGASHEDGSMFVIRRDEMWTNCDDELLADARLTRALMEKE